MIIAVGGDGGGIGRTTTALGLAAAAAAAGDDVVLFDCAPDGYGAEAATRSMNALAEILGYRPRLRVQTLGRPDAVDWARERGFSARVSILDLPPGRQAEFIPETDAVVVPVPDGQLSTLDMLLSVRFDMVIAERGVPVFALPVRVRGRTAANMTGEEVEREGVQLLRARIPERMALAAAIGSPWESDWAVLGQLYERAWAELRQRCRGD